MTQTLHRLRRASLVGLLALIVAGCAQLQPSHRPEQIERVDRLLTLIQQRLAVADAVARSKWNTQAPIEDAPREKQIIDQVGGRAPEFGLNAAQAQTFFRAQIEASKQVQTALHARWKSEQRPLFSPAPDLAKEVRPVLDRLTPDLMRALADVEAKVPVSMRKPLLQERTQQLKFDDAAYKAAFATAVQGIAQ